MQKTLLSLGVIVLFAGLIVFSLSYTFEQTDESERVAGSRVTDLTYGQWKTSAVFEKGEKVYVAFMGPNLEDVPNGDQESGTMLINITDPIGGNTTFQVDYKGATAPEMNITLLSSSEGLEVNALDFGDFSDSPQSLGGTTSYEGTYHVYIYTYSQSLAVNYYYPPSGIMDFIEFYRMVPIRTYQYAYLLPIGVAAVISGIILSAWAAKNPQRGRRSKHK